MAGEGIDSVHLLRKMGARWTTEARWGTEVGDPPWDLVHGQDWPITLDGSSCARRSELLGAGQCAAVLMPAGADRLAWVTSSRLGWTPPATLETVLSWIPRVGHTDGVRIRAHHASTAAHDIRNQLSLALLRLERLAGAPDEELSALRGSLRSGRAMCNAFLEGAEPHGDVSLRPLLEEEVRGALEASTNLSISVSLRCGARMFAHAPEMAVRRFVQNALSNSLAASPAGSSVLVEVMSAGPGSLEVAVEDHGAGLGAEDVARFFSCGRSGRDSTGVGSESLIHAADSLGSPLTVCTGPGEGTRVSVRMQAARSDRPVAILLDRDPPLRALVREHLEDAGWWVVCAKGVEDAVAGIDRWGAAIAVHRRGATGGACGGLRDVAGDLGVALVELIDGDEGGSLPPPE